MSTNNDGRDPTGYLGLNPVQNPPVIRARRAPTTADRRFKVGTTWIDQLLNQVYVLTSAASGLATWTLAAVSTTFSSLTASTINITGGSPTSNIGTATLTAGTVTVADTNITTSDRIMISRRSANGSVTLGVLSYSISAGASFTITSLILGTPASTQSADVSIVDYVIFRQV